MALGIKLLKVRYICKENVYCLRTNTNLPHCESRHGILKEETPCEDKMCRLRKGISPITAQMWVLTVQHI